MRRLSNLTRSTHASRAALMQLLMWVLLLRLHPKPLIYTPSYEYSVSFAGVAFGVATGLRRAKHLHSTGALLPVLWEQGGALAVVRRLTLGAPWAPGVDMVQNVASHPCARKSRQLIKRASRPPLHCKRPSYRRFDCCGWQHPSWVYVVDVARSMNAGLVCFSGCRLLFDGHRPGDGQEDDAGAAAAVLQVGPPTGTPSQCSRVTKHFVARITDSAPITHC